MIPFRFPMTQGECLGFDLRHNGPRAIKLVKVWAEVPAVVLDRHWHRKTVPGHLIPEWKTVNGKQCLRYEYLANTAPPDVRKYGPAWNLLHPHIYPKPEPYFLR